MGRTFVPTVGMLCLVLAGCARGEIDEADTSIGMHDASVDGPGSGMDAARMDVPIDRAMPGADVPEAMDRTPPRDVQMPMDVQRDTAPTMMCVPSCTSHAECQSSCPPAAPGYINCCLSGSGGGTCYQNMGTTCPSGGGGSDSGTTGGGAPGDFCSSDSECGSAGANCCDMSFGIGLCGCRVGPGFPCSTLFCG